MTQEFSRAGWEVGPWLIEPDKVCQVWNSWSAEVERQGGDRYKELVLSVYCPPNALFRHRRLGDYYVDTDILRYFNLYSVDLEPLSNSYRHSVFLGEVNAQRGKKYATIDQTLRLGLKIAQQLSQYSIRHFPLPVELPKV